MKNNGVKLKSIIESLENPRGGRVIVPKVSFQLHNEKFTVFLQYTYLTLLPKKIGSQHEIYVDENNPNNCILAPKYYVITDMIVLLSLISLFLIFLISNYINKS